MTEQPIGILGGTFDPVHRAHLQLAEDACANLGLVQVLWIPAGNPPHRDRPQASAEQRLAMVALALNGYPQFTIDDSEVRSSAPSYTVATLQRLRAIHGARPLVLLLGADAFHGLSKWHRWRELFALAHIAIATRPGYALDAQALDGKLHEEYLRRRSGDYSCLTAQAAGCIITFAITPLDISASAIRARLAAGQEIQDLLPKPVLDYIANNHLYSGH
ncbi:putative nicotinate-nucleotide adenylyltransferase [Georgfuchsia toluolica]|uniref:Probable nicotinate-nucleotide adenylyltransferase n=1 Tax=Georgfuchsia toluolica TaxID=424218 RepID=A0A916J6P2_9PROT|nr:nicotinate-nucleotide adenylyltransferase [Georgfuchsia toluolica]CAG4884175.1 putative nicotinate-nucleotide adenylyltransferase [Georgfuchsia toluolica]